MTLVKFNGRPVVKYDNPFNDFFGFPSGNAQYATPSTNIYETPQSYQLELNVPGRDKQDFKINIDNGLLTISYQQKEEATVEGIKSIRREFSATAFKRSFTLDEKINTEAIQAKYENGILKIELPKREDAKAEPKQIAIN